MAFVKTTIVIRTEPTRTLEYIKPNLYKIKECNSYLVCKGSWPTTTTTVTYNTLCKLLEADLFVLI